MQVFQFMEMLANLTRIALPAYDSKILVLGPHAARLPEVAGANGLERFPGLARHWGRPGEHADIFDGGHLVILARIGGVDGKNRQDGASRLHHQETNTGVADRAANQH